MMSFLLGSALGLLCAAGVVFICRTQGDPSPSGPPRPIPPRPEKPVFTVVTQGDGVVSIQSESELTPPQWDAASAAFSATLEHFGGAIGQVRSLKLEAGDVLVLSLFGGYCLSEEGQRNVKRNVDDVLPDGVKALVLTEGLRIEQVLKPHTAVLLRDA
jgi:hypothetical protein